jgi:hypothetical protein
MRGGALPPALLFAALGLALAFAPRRARAVGLAALLAGVGASSLLPLPESWLEGVYLAFWTSVIATAASVHFVRGLAHPWVAPALALNSGLWASAVVRLSGAPIDLLHALPFVLVLVPAWWLVDRRTAIPVKVVASWIIAVAVLAAGLQLIDATPGYLPDHLE